MTRHFVFALLVVAGCRSERQPAIVSSTTAAAPGDSHPTPLDSNRRKASLPALINAAGRTQNEGGRALTARLVAELGPIHLTGFADGAAIRGWGQEYDGPDERLNGLQYQSSDATLMVATRATFERWLQERSAPNDVITALSKPETYWVATQHSALTKYATIPVDGTPGATVVAMLGLFAQDTGPWPPEDILLGMIVGDRVAFVTARARVVIPIPAACRGLSPDAPAFYDCYDKQVSKDPEFARIVTQANALAARIAAGLRE